MLIANTYSPSLKYLYSVNQRFRNQLFLFARIIPLAREYNIKGKRLTFFQCMLEMFIILHLRLTEAPSSYFQFKVCNFQYYTKDWWSFSRNIQWQIWCLIAYIASGLRKVLWDACTGRLIHRTDVLSIKSLHTTRVCSRVPPCVF